MSRQKHNPHYRLTDFDALLQQNGGEAPPELTEHLENCPQCREEYERYQYLHSLCTLPVESWQPSPTRHEMFQARSQFLYNVSCTFEEERGILCVLKYFCTGWRPMAAAAALIALVIGLGPVNLHFDEPAPSPTLVAEAEKTEPAPAAIVKTPVISDSFAELPGERDAAEAFLAGSRVRLGDARGLDVEVEDLGFFFLRADPGTKQGIETRFKRTEKGSELELASGMAAFSIDKLSKDRSFAVTTAEATVEVTGTQFAVWRETGTDETVVAVQRGKVAVHPAESGETQPIHVSAHHGVRLNADGRIDVLSLSDVPDMEALLATLPDERSATAPVLSPKLLEPQASPEDLLAEAREHFRAHKLALAARALDQASRLPAKARLQSEIAFFSAEVAAADKRYKDALAGFEKAEHLDHEGKLSSQTLYHRARLLHDRLGHREEGRQLWKQYLQRFPQGSLHEETLFSLAKSYTGDDRSQAERYARRYLDRYPDGYRAAQVRKLLEEIE